MESENETSVNKKKQNKLIEKETKFQFEIPLDEFNQMVNNSVKDKNDKPLRYLIGDFIKKFDKKVSLFENRSIELQKRNNILYEETTRNDTCYLRIHAECKCCPKELRVKYIFSVTNKPKGNEKEVIIDGVIKGNHTQQNVTSFIQSSSLISSPTLTSSPTTSLRHNISSSNIITETSIHQQENQLQSCTRFKRKSKFSNGLINLAKKRKQKRINLLNDNASNNVDVSELVTKLTNKIMIKLDQINLKVNQINDRLYEIDRRIELLEDPLEQ